MPSAWHEQHASAATPEDNDGTQAPPSITSNSVRGSPAPSARASCPVRQSATEAGGEQSERDQHRTKRSALPSMRTPKKAIATA